MALKRFKVTHIALQEIVLDPTESLHAVRVLRLRAGDCVTLFDGQGREVDARITRADIDAVRVVPTEAVRTVSTRQILVICTAAPKGNRCDWLVEKCAELGVDELRLLFTRRGVVEPGSGKLDRWERKAIAAAKQARTANTMRVVAPQTLAATLESTSRSRAIVYADPASSAQPLAVLLEELGDSPIWIFVGPEGGFTDDERALLDKHGGKPASLGDSILRIETAAVAAAAVWSCVRQRA